MYAEGKADFPHILSNGDPNNIKYEDRPNELGLFGLKRNEIGGGEEKART